MKYNVCDHCGSNLDFGEVCDCRKNEDNKTERKEAQNTEKGSGNNDRN